jgi:hypothetical protein
VFVILPIGTYLTENYGYSICVYGLTEFSVPDGVTSISNGAFYGCTSLKTVYYTGSEEDWARISVSSWGNSKLEKANIVYNYVPEK